MEKLRIEKIKLQDLSAEDQQLIKGGEESVTVVVAGTIIIGTIAWTITGASNTDCNGNTCNSASANQGRDSCTQCVQK